MDRIGKLLSCLLSAAVIFGFSKMLLQTAEPASGVPAQTNTAAPAAPQENTLTITFVGNCMFASDHGEAKKQEILQFMHTPVGS